MGFMKSVKKFAKGAFGGDSARVKQQSTLDPWQKKLQAAMGQQQLTMFPQMQQNLFELANAPGGGQFFQNIFANPYLQKRERAWETIQGQMGYGGKMHGSAIAKAGGQFDRETNMDLLQQQAQMQMGAMQQLFGGSIMGRQTTENIVQAPKEGWLAKVGQVATTAGAIKGMFG